MSLADMTITPVAAPAPNGKPTTPSPSHRAPSGPPAVITRRDGNFTAAGGPAEPLIRREGAATGAPPPANATEILRKFGATWAQPAPAADAEAKPAEGGAPATGEAKPEGQAPTAATAQEPAKEAAKPADAPLPVALPEDYRAAFGERKPAEVRAEIDRVLEANRRLTAEVETARKAPTPTEDDAGAYIDNSVADIRRRIARALAVDEKDASVEDELRALTLDLNAAVFGASLDDAQQAKRDAAKARQALARDTRSRKAQGESVPSSEETQRKQATAFIGNRLSATRTAPDGKALPSMREQFPLSTAMAALPGAPTLEDQLYDVYRRESATGRFDPARANDDDYLITEAGKILESHYQALADTLGKARTPSTAAPPATSPAPAPAAAPSASQGQPQGHGGRTALTAADSSVAPPTPPPTPAPKVTPKSRAERDQAFYAKWYPKQ